MARTDPSAVSALARLNEERARVDQRIAEARKAAACELGDAVLSAGAETIPPRDLRALLGAVMAVGPAKALELLAGAAPPPARKGQPRATAAQESLHGGA